MKRILIVDDDPTFNAMLTGFLERKNHQVSSAHSARSAFSLIKNKTFDLILTDFRLPDLDGLAFVQKLRAENITTPFILITNYSDIRTAVRSIKLGAYEFVTKPVNPDELLEVAERAMDDAGRKGTLPSRETLPDDYVIGTDPASLQLWEHLGMVAPTRMNVLITGESGTGKEKVARMIHSRSNRAGQPFIAVDCGLLTDELAASEFFGHVKGAFTGAVADKKGYFELANKGTIFLDEVGNLSYNVQIKLLRAIQERVIRPVGSDREIAVDIRIIAATNEPLAEAIHHGAFRHDLLHRLNEFELKVPALRQRPGDFETFVNAFIRSASVELEKNVSTIAPEALQVLKNYAWPGNLRELRNIIKRCVLLCQGERIEVVHIPEGLLEDSEPSRTPGNASPAKPFDLKELQEQQERMLIERVLKENKFNKSKAARLLNIDRSTLYNKIRQYGIDA